VCDVSPSVVYQPVFVDMFIPLAIPTPIIIFFKFVLMGTLSYASCHALERPGNALLQRLIGPARLTK
jgi:hypothetical protein